MTPATLRVTLFAIAVIATIVAILTFVRALIVMYQRVARSERTRPSPPDWPAPVDDHQNRAEPPRVPWPARRSHRALVRHALLPYPGAHSCYRHG